MTPTEEQLKDWAARLGAIKSEMEDDAWTNDPACHQPEYVSLTHIAWKAAHRAIREHVARDELAFLEPFAPATNQEQQ